MPQLFFRDTFTTPPPPQQRTKCFSVYEKADVIIFRCLLRFLCITSVQENHQSHIAVFSQPAPGHAIYAHIVLLW